MVGRRNVFLPVNPSKLEKAGRRELLAMYQKRPEPRVDWDIAFAPEYKDKLYKLRAGRKVLALALVGHKTPSGLHIERVESFDRRRRGVGTLLFRHLISLSSKKGLGGRIYIEASPYSVDFYRKIGMKEIGKEGNLTKFVFHKREIGKFRARLSGRVRTNPVEVEEFDAGPEKKTMFLKIRELNQQGYRFEEASKDRYKLQEIMNWANQLNLKVSYVVIYNPNKKEWLLYSKSLIGNPSKRWQLIRSPVFDRDVSKMLSLTTQDSEAIGDMSIKISEGHITVGKISNIRRYRLREVIRKRGQFVRVGEKIEGQFNIHSHSSIPGMDKPEKGLFLFSESDKAFLLNRKHLGLISTFRDGIYFSVMFKYKSKIYVQTFRLFRSINPFRVEVTCPKCGKVAMIRSGWTTFTCFKCGNIVDRQLHAPYFKNPVDMKEIKRDGIKRYPQANKFLSKLHKNPPTVIDIYPKYHPDLRGRFDPDNNIIGISAYYNFRDENDRRRTIIHEIAEWIEYLEGGEAFDRRKHLHGDDTKFQKLRKLVKRAYPNKPELIREYLSKMVKNPGSSVTLKQVVAKLKVIPGVRSIELFGSRARGSYKPDSDYDIMVWIEPGVEIANKYFKMAFGLPDIFDIKFADDTKYVGDLMWVTDRMSWSNEYDPDEGNQGTPISGEIIKDMKVLWKAPGVRKLRNNPKSYAFHGYTLAEAKEWMKDMKRKGTVNLVENPIFIINPYTEKDLREALAKVRGNPITPEAFIGDMVGQVATASFGVGMIATILGTMLVNFIQDAKTRVETPYMPAPPSWVTQMIAELKVIDPKISAQDLLSKINTMWDLKSREDKLAIYEQFKQASKSVKARNYAEALMKSEEVIGNPIRIFKQGNHYLLDGISHKEKSRMKKMGWSWIRAPRGAGPGCYSTKDRKLAELSAKRLGIKVGTNE